MSRVVIIGGSGHIGAYLGATAGLRRIRGGFRQSRTAHAVSVEWRLEIRAQGCSVARS